MVNMKEIIKVGLSNNITWIFVVSRKLTDSENKELNNIVGDSKFTDSMYSYPDMYFEIMDYLTKLGICISNEYTFNTVFRTF